jgi:hypothetical protein
MSVELLWRKAIIEMHEKGYNQDFKLSGNKVLWLQGKVRLQPEEYSILEVYRIYKSGDKNSDLIVLGILSACYNVKGILLIEKSQAKKSPVINTRLDELRLHLLDITPGYLLNNSN